MPRKRKYRLQWVQTKDGRRRWRKQYKKRVYHFEVKPGESKATSYDRCLKLWEAKKVEIDSEESSLRHQVKEVLLELLSQISQSNPKFSESLLGLGVNRPDTEAPDPKNQESLVDLVDQYTEVNKKTNKMRLLVFQNWCPAKAGPEAVNGSFLRNFHSHLEGKIDSGDWSAAYVRCIFVETKTFIRRLYDEVELIDRMPRNMSKLRFNVPVKQPESYSIEKVKTYLENAEERAKLYILLALNCGMTPIDMADLLPREVDWKNGRITRKRSKTRQTTENVPVVNYKLWPETLRLLKRFRDRTVEVAKELGVELTTVLLTEQGTPLATRSQQGSPSNNSVRMCLWRLNKRLKNKAAILTFKKTSASLIDREFDHATAQLFLGHSPGTIGGRHYIAVEDTRLDQPLAWLAEQYGLTERLQPRPIRHYH